MNERQCLDGSSVRRRAVDQAGREAGRLRLRRRLGRQPDAVAVPRGISPTASPRCSGGRKHSRVLGTWISPWGGYGKARPNGWNTARRKASRRTPAVLAGRTEVLRAIPRGLRGADRELRGQLLQVRRLGPGRRAPRAGRRVRARHRGPAATDRRLARRSARPVRQHHGGTWPSPYWLWYGDSIWRSGRDCGLRGRLDPAAVAHLPRHDRLPFGQPRGRSTRSTR